jgi:pantoate--beta-alanine ligase
LRFILKPFFMRIFKERESLHNYLSGLRRQDSTIGFVPTMGALHAGHLSLLETAAKQCDVVVCSIFVNPLQFNDRQDFEKYPVNTTEDIAKLLGTDTDILFLPSVDEVYNQGTLDLAGYDFSDLESRWEGSFRPGHFQGVAQVMARLLEAVRPHLLFMGQKDLQQLLIIDELIRMLSLDTELVCCPTLREPDGLAMSSRNLRLSPEARQKAPLIHQTLLFIEDNLYQVPFAELIKQGMAQLEKAGFQVDYLAIVRKKNLQPVEQPTDESMVCLVAAWLDGIRLIDNQPLN